MYITFKCASFLFFLLIFFTCKDSKSPEPEDNLFGTWNWVESSGGWSGDTINPDIVGYSIKIVFQKDSVYKEYLNDSLIVSMPYKIVQKPYGSTENERDFLVLENFRVDQMIEYEGSNILILTEMCFDCSVKKYIKVGDY
jgi:hypothetical protein